jgi:acyl-CoA thioesterase
VDRERDGRSFCARRVVAVQGGGAVIASMPCSSTVDDLVRACVLTDLVPHSVAGGRGWYSGSVSDAPGRLAASLTQAVLSRPTPYGGG